ncbi:hypothetical protein F4861DRAFT_328592 [Xylaria intraflava]|nr:hypothetical protein F4861DRAFT_328592 [Xylaria intraflava]
MSGACWRFLVVPLQARASSSLRSILSLSSSSHRTVPVCCSLVYDNHKGRHCESSNTTGGLLSSATEINQDHRRRPLRQKIVL